jgi:hypothetical protein
MNTNSKLVTQNFASLVATSGNHRYEKLRGLRSTSLAGWELGYNRPPNNGRIIDAGRRALRNCTGKQIGGFSAALRAREVPFEKINCQGGID